MCKKSKTEVARIVKGEVTDLPSKKSSAGSPVAPSTVSVPRANHWM